MNFADADFLAWSCAHPDGVADQFHQRLDNGTELQLWDSGVLVAEPAQAGDKQVVISCAVHGNETAPIELLRDMVADVRSGKLQLAHRTLFLIANPASINAGRRFVEENMNRLFSGEHSNA
ncbi:MAG: succinylglutamate desuccinylase, partial [Puniceicoccales bacterium]